MDTKKAINLSCVLYCLGCKIPFDDSCATNAFNDNFSVVENAQNSVADVSKKHMAIYFMNWEKPSLLALLNLTG